MQHIHPKLETGSTNTNSARAKQSVITEPPLRASARGLQRKRQHRQSQHSHFFTHKSQHSAAIPSDKGQFEQS